MTYFGTKIIITYYQSVKCIFQQSIPIYCSTISPYWYGDILLIISNDPTEKKQPQKECIMSKGQDSKKSAKKKPLLTAKEKKAAKANKKTSNNVFGI